MSSLPPHLSQRWAASLTVPCSLTAPKQDEAPTVTSMKDVTVEEGEAARFSAKITGKPTPTVSWLRENTLIPQSRDFKVSHGRHRVGRLGQFKLQRLDNVEVEVCRTVE